MKKRPYPSFSVLLVDDEPLWLTSLGMALSGDGGITNLIECRDSREVMGLLSRENVGLVLLDLTMPHLSGEDLLAQIAETYPHVLTVVVTGVNEVERAVRCIKAGAYDYYVKTNDKDHMVTGILHAIRTIELQSENRTINTRLLSDRLETPEAFAGIITISEKLLMIFRYIEAIAPSRQPVLVTGESGVGKELIVKALHKAGRYEAPLVTVNLAGLDDNLFADTLFGHRRGAYTGAAEERRGLVNQAEETILFLDEIGDLSLASQVKLLRLLQDGEYYPVGSDQLRRTKTRFVLATNEDLVQKQGLGQFRKDLFYRLQTHHIHVPPLREHKEDIPLLLVYFVQQAAQELGIPEPAIPKPIAPLLMQYDFPGNVRELRSLIFDEVSRHQGTLSVEGFRMKLFHHPAGEPATDADDGDDDAVSRSIRSVKRIPTYAEADAMLTEEALRRAEGNQTVAARMLGISQPALSRRLSLRKQAAQR